MTRGLPRVLAVLGLLCLLVAPVLRLVVAPYLAQWPVEPGREGFLNHVSTGSVTGLLDLTGEIQRDPVPVTRSETTKGDAQASAQAAAQGLNVGLYHTISRVIGADQKVIREDNYQLAADRRTAALVDCCGAFVGGVVVPMAGAGYPLRFPALTRAAPYPYFDVNLLAAAQMDYLGREEAGGMAAMKFQQSTPPTPVGKLLVPGRLVGSAAAEVAAQRTYSATRTLWVDPVTGIILRKSERIRETLRDEAGKDAVVLYSAALVSTAEQTAAEVRQARAQGRPIRWAHTTGPVLLVLLGVGLLLAAAVITLTRRRDDRARADFPDDWASFDDLRERG